MLHRDCERIDILVHNAAAMRMGRIADAPVEDLDLQYRTNVRAPYLLTQGLLPMLRQRRGQIVFMNSSAGLTAGAGVGPYAATKHALKALADSLREEVNRDGVRVVSVFPGRTATPLQEQVHAWERRPYRPERLLQAEDIAATVVNALCLPPTAEVTDIKIRSMTKPEIIQRLLNPGIIAIIRADFHLRDAARPGVGDTANAHGVLAAAV